MKIRQPKSRIRYEKLRAQKTGFAVDLPQFVPFLDHCARFFRFRLKVVHVNIWFEFDLLNFDLVLRLAVFLLFFRSVVPEPVVCGQAANRRLGRRGDLDEIETLFFRQLESLLEVHYSHVVPIFLDHTHFF